VGARTAGLRAGGPSPGEAPPLPRLRKAGALQLQHVDSLVVAVHLQRAGPHAGQLLAVLRLRCPSPSNRADLLWLLRMLHQRAQRSFKCIVLCIIHVLWC
jgi:hypothetical protein